MLGAVLGALHVGVPPGVPRRPHHAQVPAALLLLLLGLLLGREQLGMLGLLGLLGLLLLGLLLLGLLLLLLLLLLAGSSCLVGARRLRAAEVGA